MSLSVTPNTNISPSSITLTSDDGISNNSPFTLSTPTNAPTNYYKVITFTNALTSNTDFTFSATSGKRFVIWGVNAEEEDTDPTISATPASLTGFTYIEGNGPSAAQTISVSGENLTANLGLSLGASSDFEMSLSEDSGYANALELTPTSGAVAATTVYVRLKSGLAVNSSYSGTVTLTSTDATDVTVSLSGSVTNQTYTLTDESGVNGSIAFSASPVEAGTHVVLTPTPASDAYYFVADSWSFFNDALEDVTSSIEFVTGETNTIVMPAYNLHVDATFAAKPTYDVFFDCNGGTSGCPSDMEDVIQGTAITLPAAPTKADNVFTGWNDGTTTYAAGDSYTVNDDVIFTAQWTPGGTGTILFGKKDGGGSTEINDATVTGDDSEGNTWTIKTVGTTSFTNTNNSGYSQVGSSSSPATSITFATKLSSTSTFTGFSAKFGGFNSTAGTVTLKVYNHSTSTETTVGTGSLNGTSDVTISNTSTAVGDSLTVTVTSIAKGVKCYYVSYSYSTSSDPIISAPNELSLGSLDTYTEFDYSIINPSTGVTLGATTTDTWISNIIVTADKVSFETTANPSETEDRTGTITLSYTGAENKTVTVTQSKVDYATLPFTYEGNGVYEVPNCFETNLSGSYSDAPKMKFDATGKYLTLHLNEAPTSLSYDIKGNSFSGGTFKVQTSADGATWNVLAEYTTLAATTQTITHIDLASTVRYIKWIYANKSSGNVALGNIKASANYDIYSDVTVASLTIPADKVCTVYSPATLNVTASLTNEATSEAWNNLVIKDGAQLKTPNAVKGTIEKFVAGYGESTNGNYVLLATPATLDACNNTGMWPSETAQHVNVDFYAFDQSFAGAEWRNYKYGHTYFAGPFAMTQGTGYLYANKNDVTLTLETRGYVSPNVDWQDHPFAPTNVNQSVTLEYSDGKPFAGFNLIGNPFTCNAYINRDYYRMNAAGDAIIAAESSATAIKPCEGIFVVAADAGDNSVTFSATAPSSAPANVVINLKDNEMVRDRAIVSFEEGRDMPRFQFNDAAAKLYIPQRGMEFAKVSSETQGEVPVNFKADKNGSFTLSIDAANLDVDYLHLIDNLTGTDVDLLATPSYTFDARTSDYDSRFRLVFSVNSIGENSDNGSATFAYFNGSEWVINASDNATVQVVDVMGRVILNSDAKHGVSTANMPAGVYMLRLVNGNNVKVQKIVVR